MFKSKPTATIEADIASLEKRRASLETRQARAATDLLNSVATRRQLLVDADEPDARALATADRACREAEDAQGAAADALEQVQARIADAQDRLARLQAAEERERQAVAIEASAGAADKAIDRIRKSTAEIDRARVDLAAALTATGANCYAPPSQHGYAGEMFLTRTEVSPYDAAVTLCFLDAEVVASRIAGHLVASALPTLAVADLVEATSVHLNGATTKILGSVEGADAARALLTDPMRRHASAVRCGAEVVMSDPASEPGPPADFDPREVPEGFDREELAPGVTRLRPHAASVAA